jgi:octaprenyl-diphosphate synthase
MTLPLIYTLNKVDSSTRKKLINIVKNQNDKAEKVNEVIRIVHESGGMEYATAVMMRFRNEAVDILNEFPDSSAKSSLQKLIDFTIKRSS